MRFMKFLAGAGLAVMLVACGGGGGVGTTDPGTGPGSASTAASITVTSSSANISTAAGATNATVTITAEVRNAAGTGVSGEPVTFSTDSGALTNASTTTGTGAATGGALGRATAVLSVGNDRTPRNITVTVTVGAVSNKIVVPVVSAASSIEVLSSAVSLPSGSDAAITITALVKNEANNGIADEPIKFSADSGVLQNAASVTSANGTATATLAVGANKSQRNITVTATAGAMSKTIVIPVSGTALSITGPSSLLVGGGASYTATLKDSNGAAVAGVEVQVASLLGNTLTPAKAATDSSGVATFQYRAANNGTDTLTVTGAGVSAQQRIVMSEVNFAFTLPNSIKLVTVNTPEKVTVKYMSNGAPVAGQDVYFSSTRGEVSPASVKTDANGEASTMATASTAGPATISALLGGSSTVATASLNYYAVAPATIVLQANPSAVRPNAVGTTANTAALVAVVRDTSGNAVKDAVVNFTLVRDTSGGAISPGTGVTDANGRVSASFIPGSTTTAARGVEIRASTGNGMITSTASLTVSNQALFIAIATSNTIGNKDGDDTVYSKPFSVQVNDANGAAVANQTVTLAIYPPTYRKGRLGWNGTSWGMISSLTVQCPNEDVDRSGILSGGNRDIDGNGVLTPGIPGVVAPASVVTDATGFAKFNVLYGEQYVPWIDFEITARALVAGTESSNTFFYAAAGLSSDFTNETSAPAGVVSPFNLTRLGPDGLPLDNASRTSACNGSLN